MANLQFGIHSLRQLLHESIMDATLHQKAVGAHTGLQQRDTLQVRHGKLRCSQLQKCQVNPSIYMVLKGTSKNAMVLKPYEYLKFTTSLNSYEKH